MTERVSDTLAIVLTLPDTVGAGAPVTITLLVTNRTDRRLTLYLRGRQIVFDVIVRRPDGSPVWRKLEGEVVPAIVRVEELASGATLTLRDEWGQQDQAGRPVAPGEYLVTAEILTDGEPLRAPAARLRIR